MSLRSSLAIGLLIAFGEVVKEAEWWTFMSTHLIKQTRDGRYSAEIEYLQLSERHEFCEGGPMVGALSHLGNGCLSVAGSAEHGIQAGLILLGLLARSGGRVPTSSADWGVLVWLVVACTDESGTHWEPSARFRPL